jgi:ribonuclease P protein component
MKNNFISNRDRKIISDLKKNTNIARNNSFTISYIACNETKYLLIATKKNFKLAVQRNLIRRQIKMMLQEYQQNKPVAISIIVNRNYLQLSFAKNKENLFALFNKITL